jgi:hypothetical protein
VPGDKEKHSIEAMWAKNHSIEWWTHAFHNPLRCVCKRLDGISWTTYLIIAILYCVNEVSLLQLVDARGISPLARTWMSRNARGSFPSSFALTHPGQGARPLSRLQKQDSIQMKQPSQMTTHVLAAPPHALQLETVAQNAGYSQPPSYRKVANAMLELESKC